MDNFMDMLAKRFNAGEIIKANNQAEARDMRRMQEQAAEYERMMQEMRRLNLKNVEMTEQVQQLIQCGIEQLEGYGSGEGLLGNMIDETRAGLRAEVAAMQEAFKEDTDFVKKNIETLKTDVESVKEEIKPVKNYMYSVKYNVDFLKDNANSTKDDIDSIKEEMESFKDSVSDAVHKKNNEEFGRMSSRMDEMEHAIHEGVQQNQRALSKALKDLEDKAGDDSELKESIRSLKGILAELRLDTEEGLKHLEEHVHKENVRVYRNVQAAVSEEAAGKAKELGERMDRLESALKKDSGVKTLVIVTLLFAVASFAMQILQML